MKIQNPASTAPAAHGPVRRRNYGWPEYLTGDPANGDPALVIASPMAPGSLPGIARVLC
jgi:hypothetical protein